MPFASLSHTAVRAADEPPPPPPGGTGPGQGRTGLPVPWEGCVPPRARARRPAPCSDSDRPSARAARLPHPPERASSAAVTRTSPPGPDAVRPGALAGGGGRGAGASACRGSERGPPSHPEGGDGPSRRRTSEVARQKARGPEPMRPAAASTRRPRGGQAGPVGSLSSGGARAPAPGLSRSRLGLCGAVPVTVARAGPPAAS